MLENSPITSFLHIVDRYSSNTALVYFEEHNRDINELQLKEMSYQELDKASTSLAYQLLRHIKSGDVVCILMQQSHYYIIAMLACWKAGAVYMPITWNGLENDDTNISGIQSRLAKADVKLIVSGESYQDRIGSLKINHPTISIEDALKDTVPFLSQTSPKKSDPAYIICSSGTTSAPKMIDVPFAAVMQRIQDAKVKLEINARDCMLALLNFAFDASIMEVLIALTEGIPLIIAPEQVRGNILGLGQLFQRLEREGHAITTAIFIPKILNHQGEDIFAPCDFPGLRKFLSTGDAFSHPERLNKWFDANIRIFNGYGPTETTFGATITELKRNEGIPIYQNAGDVFQGLVLLRLVKESTDTKWRLAETGDGMLFIAGEGLAHYHANSELNEKYFIQQKDYEKHFDNEVIERFKLNEYPCVYKTFDIVRMDARSNKMFFQYRDDRVIKIAGGQINLDTIEKYFTEKFRPALAIYHQDNIKVFFRHSNPLPADIIALKTILASTENKLRANVYFWLNDADAAAHKTNRKPDYLLSYAQMIILENQEQNFTHTEKKVAGIWRSLIQHAQLFKTCDFVAHLGADSLTLMQMINRVWKELLSDKEQPTATVVFSHYIQKHHTLEQIAKLIDVINVPCFHQTPDEKQEHHPVFYFGETLVLDALKKTWPTRNHFQYLGDASATDELHIINALRRIRLAQLNGPYLLVCTDESYKLFCERLMQTLATQNESATIIADPDQLAGQLINQTKVSLLTKIKKAQADALNNHLPAIDETNYLFASGKTTWLLGDSCSGKTLLLQQFLQSFWSRHEQHSLNAKIPIYFSLQGGQLSAINDWLIGTAKLNTEELLLLKTMPVIFLLDDYDLINREDFPNLRLTNSVVGHSTVIIACRSRHMLDKRCWENMGEDEKILLPRVEKSMVELLDHEKKRLKLKQLHLPTLDKLIGKVISLDLMPSVWEPSQRNKEAMSYLHNYSFANFIRELLLPIDAEKHLYQFPAGLKLPTFTPEINIETTHTKTIIRESIMDESLVPIVENYHGKPIFAFAPLTGDTPHSYRKLSNALGIHQPFYVLQLSKSGVDRVPDLAARSLYYAKIIQAVYPQGSMILLGWSFGAMQAYAVAKALRNQYQRQIELLINIDCPNPQHISQIDHAICARDMVTVLSHEIYRSTVEPCNGKDPQIIFDNAISRADGINKSLSTALRNAQLNFTAYTTFNQYANECLPIPMLTFQAGKKHRSINENADYRWPCDMQENILVENADHFNIVVDEIVVKRLVHVLAKLQPHSPGAPLLNRLQHYVANTLLILQRTPSYIELELKRPASTESVLLTKLFSDFLAEERPYTLVVCGEAGAGKTAAFKFMQYQLLQQFGNHGFIPVYFNCRFTSVSDVTALLLSTGLSMQEIATHAYKKILFLVDGFDECKHSASFLNLIISLNQYGKVAVNSRNYVYESLDNPSLYFGVHKKYELLPLTTVQIQAFINDPTAFAFLMTLFQINDLLQNPLTLNLIKRLLPEIKRRDTTKILTRYELYQLMFDKLFYEKTHEVAQDIGIRPGVLLQSAFINFAQVIGAELWQNENFVLPDDIDTRQVMRACLLTLENNRLRFQHYTYHEFFVAQAIISELQLSCDRPDKYQPILMSNIVLKHEASLLKFITEAIQALENDRYMIILHQLWTITYTTRWIRDDSRMKKAAGNAVTILNTLMPLSGLILNDIQVEQANLEGAILDGTRFDHAYVDQTNFARVLMNKTSLRDTKFNNPSFGEYPSLSFSGLIKDIACAPNDDRIAIIIDDSVMANENFDLPARMHAALEVWDSRRQLKLIEIVMSEPLPQHLSFSSDGKVLFSLTSLLTGIRIKHYDAQTLIEIHSIEMPIDTASVTYQQVQNDQLFIFIANRFEIWSLVDCTKKSETPLSLAQYDIMALSHDGKHVACKVGEKESVIINLINGQVLSRIISDNTINCMAFVAAQPNIVLVGGEDTSLRCYDILSAQFIRQLYAQSLLQNLYIHPNGFIFNLATHEQFFGDRNSNIETYQMAVPKRNIFQTRNKLAPYGKLHPVLPIIASQEEQCILLTHLACEALSRKIVMSAAIIEFCLFNNELFILDNTGLLHSFEILSGRLLKQYQINHPDIHQYLNERVTMKICNDYLILYIKDKLLICSIGESALIEVSYLFDSTILMPENVTEDDKHFNVFIQFVEILDNNNARIGVHIVHHHGSGCVDYDEYSIVLEWNFKENNYRKVVEICHKNIEDVDHDYPSFFESCNDYLIMRHRFSLYFYDPKTYALLHKRSVSDIHDLILINHGKQLALCDEESKFYIYNVCRATEGLTVDFVDTYCHRGLFYNDEHYGIDSLSYNYQLNLFYACSPSMASLWHIDTSSQPLVITLIQDNHYHLSCSNLLMDNFSADNITQRLLADSDTAKDKSTEKVLPNYRVPPLSNTCHIKRRTHLSSCLPDDVFISHILIHLSYYDRFMLSRVNHYFYHLTHHDYTVKCYGPLLQTAMINLLKEEVYHYFKRLFINNFQGPPDIASMRIKPDRQSASLVRIGFFAPGRATGNSEFKVPVLWLVHLPIQMHSGITSLTDPDNMLPAPLGKGCV